MAEWAASPGWILVLAESLRQFGDVHLLDLAPQSPIRCGRLFRLFRHIDHRLLPRDSRRFLQRLDVLPAAVTSASADRLQAADVALYLGDGHPPAEWIDLPRLGIWRLGFGETADSGMSAFWSTITAAPTTRTTLTRLGAGPESDCVLYKSQSRTYTFSPARNRLNALRKALQFPARVLRGGGVQQFTAEPRSSPPSTPGNGEMIGIALRMLTRVARRAMEKMLLIDQWFIAYAFDLPADGSWPLDRAVPLFPSKDRFWADPFVIERDGRYFVFFEELIFARGKAHISVLEISEVGAGTPCMVLERDYHLSYPYLFEWEGELYMLPETGHNRTVELYRCVEFPQRWELVKTLLAGVWAVDATIEEIDGRWWMFVTQSVEGAEIYDELYLYHADSPLGAWHPHPMNPVVSDVRFARSAGRLFREQDGAWIRPAQNCAPIYGASVVLRRILELTPDLFREETVRELPADWRPRLEGFHTLNRTGRLTVVDGFIRRPRWK